jgi:hypothetical protein
VRAQRRIRFLDEPRRVAKLEAVPLPGRQPLECRREPLVVAPERRRQLVEFTSTVSKCRA